MSIFLNILLGIAVLAAVIVIYGFIVGCFRYWDRQPYDDDMSFMDFIRKGIVDIFKQYAKKIAIYGIIALIVYVLIMLFS